MKVFSKKALVIPDVHQDIRWAEDILEEHKGGFDKVIWLGDWFDTFDNTRFGAGATAEWLKNRIDTTDDVFCIGNHDMAYLEACLTANHGLGRQHNNLKYGCSGVTKSKYEKIKKVLGRNSWSRFVPFVLLNDNIIISHAGINEKFIGYVHQGEVEAALERLYDKAKRFLIDNIHMETEIYGCGMARGGFQDVGGITWCDFHYEYRPLYKSKYVQIVGHTARDNTIRRIKEDYCIDGNQTTYMIVKENEYEFLSTVGKPIIQRIK